MNTFVENQTWADPATGSKTIHGRIRPLLALLAAGCLAGAHFELAASGSEAPRPLSGLPFAPLCFEANRGQVDRDFQFVARGRDCAVMLAPTEAVLLLGKPGSDPPVWTPEESALGKPGTLQVHSVRLRLLGASPRAAMTGVAALSGTANYYIGSDPGAWLSGIRLYPKVQVDDVYPGVQLIYRADDTARLEYDFVVQPGARPEQISLGFENADGIEVDSAGNLVLRVAGMTIQQDRPFIYQLAGGARKRIEGGYRLEGGAVAGFWVGEYDSRRPLVIDPVFSFTSFIHGKSNDKGWGIAVDGFGDVWVAGETLSPRLPATVTNSLAKYQGGSLVYGDAFVAKFTGGTNLSFLTYFGGAGQDAAFALGVETNTSAAFVTGYTDSPDFPLYPLRSPGRAFQTQLGGTNLNTARVYPVDAFVAKFNSDGTLAYSSFLGGLGRDVGMAIAGDALGRAYVAGLTESPDFPTVNTIRGQYWINGHMRGYNGNTIKGPVNTFVARVSPGGDALEYSSYLGGANVDTPHGIAVDSLGCAYVVGTTSSINFPTTNAWLPYWNNHSSTSLSADGYISKLSADGRSLVYSTYIGGKGKDGAQSVALDSAGNAYVTGHTYSTDFRLTATNFTFWASGTNSNSEVFVVKLNPDGGITGGYSVAFGSKASDEGLGIAVDANQNAYITGFTSSRTNFAGVDLPAMTDFFSTNAPGGFSSTNSSRWSSAHQDAFVVELAPDGSPLFTAYVGGAGNDRANGIALDPTAASGVVAYIVGYSSSKDFPTGAPSAAHGIRGQCDTFITRMLFP